MKIVRNHCPICGDPIIGPNGKPLPNHKQKLVMIEGGHSTHIAYCNKHILDKKTVKALMKLTLQFVADEIENPEAKKQILNLKDRNVYI